jgi:hypothetical protein
MSITEGLTVYSQVKRTGVIPAQTLIPKLTMKRIRNTNCFILADND